MRLDHLQPFVHQRGRVDRDLRAHRPIRVLERVRNRHIAQLLHRPVSERAARSGQNHLAKPAIRRALQTLEDRRVLRVGGRHEHVVFLHEREHYRPARDERLLVRQRDVFPALDGGDGWEKPGAADDSRHDHFRVAVRSDFHHAVVTSHHFDGRQVRQSGFQLVVQVLVLHANDLRLEFARLLRKKRHVGAARQPNHGKHRRPLAHNVQRLHANRTRAPEQSNLLRSA
mmetsp:Transcript_3174/g.6880  ORF Transcript_3174/g.6880 Transcript_3174/m.6880 type:complete len:228 (-) Transcript_3174:94-777(-)